MPPLPELDHTRERLLEAAGPIFAEKGFEAANVREICLQAGANQGAINYHFRSKEQFYIETIRYAYRRLLATVPWSELDSPPETPPEEALHRYLLGFLRRLFLPDAQRWCHALITREMQHPTEAAMDFIHNIVRPSFERLLAIVDRLVPADTPPRERNLLAGSIIGQALHYAHSQHLMPILLGEEEARACDVSVLADHITRFSLAAIHQLHPGRSRATKGSRS